MMLIELGGCLPRMGYYKVTVLQPSAVTVHRIRESSQPARTSRVLAGVDGKLARAPFRAEIRLTCDGCDLCDMPGG
jgi:hypothetical protein